ncbi:hypothetical protein ASPZODRAFT_1474150 [Penicilliopsis zonata CBS 506.65]|uniref:Uncharacterized protein n=1 Tax=Penicilliopsis zonata CBS 506.65 TaxID=1073090 RepID=A0A1L9SQN1_9EURO|nr:hypothetical protein ASPZODRAFT_1474150 [Penicilliopsis zonata CBS 506.65]OJJ49413.1 hypothetical protein ASPZODRAFT_1474150 [Penicilliopsis zonata CBS 506.65]
MKPRVRITLGGKEAQDRNFLAEDRFRFTPVKVASSAPRLWERKASVPFLARSKSRKLWKRFRSSFNSMKSLQKLVAEEDACVADVADELDLEINFSRQTGYLRGVKRICLNEKDTEGEVEVGKERGRSFLETKWESEMARKRRKIPSKDWQPVENTWSQDVCQNSASQPDTTIATDVVEGMEEDRETTIPAIQLLTEPVHDSLSPYESNEEGSPDHEKMDDHHAGDSALAHVENESEDTAQEFTPSEDVSLLGIGGDTVGETSTADDRQTPSATNGSCPKVFVDVENSTIEDTIAQEQDFVRSALGSALEGEGDYEDAELLNNFVSKAKAKRAAKAALPPQDAEQVNDEEDAVVEFPTPRSRRVLEELDANSPSPQKTQLSPCKSDVPHESPALSNGSEGKQADDQKEGQEQHEQGSSPLRRSSRTSKPPLRTTISLRRPKGNEFIFLQRTQAQEIALATRKNTRCNKGDAQFPKFVLQALAQQQQKSDQGSSSPERSDTDTHRHKTSRKRSAKRVVWNDKRLVEYEGDDTTTPAGDDESDDVLTTAGKTTTATQSDKKKAATTSRIKEGKNSGPSVQAPDCDTVVAGTSSCTTTAPATATPSAQSVRRLGPSASALPTPATTSKARTIAQKPTLVSSASSSLSSSVLPRRKLTPRAPSSALPGTSSKTSPPTVVVSNKSRPSTTSGIKTKSMLKATAGSTPMPKRIRARS